jgi:hypothetical protein
MKDVVCQILTLVRILESLQVFEEIHYLSFLLHEFGILLVEVENAPNIISGEFWLKLVLMVHGDVGDILVVFTE